jgi:uncharacterized protein YbjT (DUF2867 family)
MKILVTGGIGKVGQWVVRELLNNPAHALQETLQANAE